MGVPKVELEPLFPSNVAVPAPPPPTITGYGEADDTGVGPVL